MYVFLFFFRILNIGRRIQTSVVFCSTGLETKTVPLHNEGSFLSGESPWKLSRFENAFINLYPILHAAMNYFAYLPPPPPLFSYFFLFCGAVPFSVLDRTSDVELLDVQA
jgi:hypothetical protein